MSRTTKRDLQDTVSMLNSMLNGNGVEGRRLTIGWAYGRPRVSLCLADNESAAAWDYSPRLPMGEMSLWLDAFSMGLSVGLSRKL